VLFDFEQLHERDYEGGKAGRLKGWKLADGSPSSLPTFSLPAFPHLLHTSPVLNIAGPDYDYGSVVFVVLQECEHRRRGWEADEFEIRANATAKEKLAQIKGAYDEFGGSTSYWEALEKEVLTVVVPQYVEHARDFNESEKKTFGVWRGGDPAARGAFALIGSSSAVSSSPSPGFPSAEDLFAFALTGAGALYPDIVRFTQERRHSRVLNRLIADSGAYQENARLHYMTAIDIQKIVNAGDSERPELTPGGRDKA